MFPITVTHSRLASNAVVSSLFDRISTCRIARPLLDARSGTRYSMSCYAFPTADCFIPVCFNALMGLSCYTNIHVHWRCKCSFNALMGLSCYVYSAILATPYQVSMPSWAWVVTARMSNILNFSWYFLCIPAIYRCILAYLPIFFNQLSKFLRCESPSTFLGTCLSHHSFIIFLVTNTNTLLSGLYLISTR